MSAAMSVRILRIGSHPLTDRPACLLYLTLSSSNYLELLNNSIDTVRIVVDIRPSTYGADIWGSSNG